MNDEELTDALRRMLHRRASTLRPGAGQPPQEGDMPGPYRQEIGRRRPPAPVLVAVAAAAALVAAVTGLAVSGGHHSTVATRTGTAAAATGATNPPSTVQVYPPLSPQASTVEPATTAPATTAAPTGMPAGFAPVSVTFVSADSGWVLGTVSCQAGRCAAVGRTTDGGATWTATSAPQVTLPASGPPAAIRFADASDGWLYTSTSLWVTHDGGATWQAQAIPGGSGAMIGDLKASAGTVYVVALRPGAGEGIYSAPATGGPWTAAPLSPATGGGPVPSPSIVLQGRTGWIVTDNRTVVSGARDLNGAGWQPWTAPCSHGNGPAGLAAASTTDLVAWCAEGLWGPPDPGTTAGQLSVLRSSDGGSTFSQVGTVPGTTISSWAVAPGQPADILAVTGSGIVRSTDGGATWSTVDPASTGGSAYVGFTTATQAVAVIGTAQAPALVMSHDGGATWSPVTF